MTADVCTTFPLHCSSKGRAILASYSPDVAARMLKSAYEKGQQATSQLASASPSASAPPPARPTIASSPPPPTRPRE